MKTERPSVPCSACVGTGTVPLSDSFVATLDLIRRLGGATAAIVLAKMMVQSKSDRVGQTGVNNRLEYLRRHGFLTRRRDGKEWVYSIAPDEATV